MSFFFFIFISFLCPFASAQLSNDYAQAAFSGYIDVLINIIVPLFIFLIADDESHDVIRAFTQSALSFAIVGLQQELAFMFSSVKVSNFIKILQHILISLTVIRVIVQFIISVHVLRKHHEFQGYKEFQSYQELKKIIRLV